MSFEYMCKIKRDLSEIVRESDHVIYKLRLLPVAEKEKMRQWFCKFLEDDGAENKGDGRLEFKMEGTCVEVDLKNDQVVISAESENKIEIHKEETVSSSYAYEFEKKLDERIEKEKKELLKKYRSKTADILRNAEDKVKARIRKAENKAIEKGLDEKADTLGKLEQKTEENDLKGNQKIIWNIRI